MKPVLLFLSLVGMSVHSYGSCDLTVRPIDKDGRIVPAEVTVEEEDGEKMSRKTSITQPEGAEFCVLDGRPVTITIKAFCGPTILFKNFWVSAAISRVLEVLAYDECMPFVVYGGCSVLIRLVNKEGTPIGEATLSLQRARFSEFRADDFGRLRIGGEVGETMRGTISAIGYESHPFEYTCKGRENTEQVIRMEAQ